MMTSSHKKQNLKKELESYYFFKSQGFDTKFASPRLHAVLICFNDILKDVEELDNYFYLRREISPLKDASSIRLTYLRDLVKAKKDTLAPKDLLFELIEILESEKRESRKNSYDKKHIKIKR